MAGGEGVPNENPKTNEENTKQQQNLVDYNAYSTPLWKINTISNILVRCIANVTRFPIKREITVCPQTPLKGRNNGYYAAWKASGTTIRDRI